MMAQSVPHQSTDKKRVKVYELRNNDWFDRGTGFCTAAFTQQSEEGHPRDPRVYVESEDQPERLLLETKICKEDGFQKQQETLIVWTEPSSGIDMALSFQEAEGCHLIWKFISGIQSTFHGGIPAPGAPVDDSLSDDLAMDMPSNVNMPTADLKNLSEIEQCMRVMNQTANGRDALAKFIMSDDYIGKLTPLVEMAEDLESLTDLHRLCNIMKTIILLNDTSIIEHAVSDACLLGVVGALEYDPDFPSHKANHRHWLGNRGRYKSVVPIRDEGIERKIHQTHRLQYLKDVVLARILDDPTFSVLNSLIFFNQVDIVQHLQGNAGYLNELFGIFRGAEVESRKKDAVLLIQQCCSIAKNLQPPARQTLYNNFIAHGLLQVINFGLRSADVGVRVGATDILAAMIEHDPHMIRQTLYRQIQENHPLLTDSLVDLLLVEADLGVRSQIADALRVLLDQGPPVQAQEAFARSNGEFPGKTRLPQATEANHELLLANFYEHSARKLFRPLMSLEGRTDMNFTVQQASMFTYLIEVLGYFIRQHLHRSKFFVLQNDIAQRVAQLLSCPEKYLQLVGIRFFRSLIGSHDDFYIKHLTEKNVFGPLLDVLNDTMPRDNLLSSACLELFEFIKKENVKDLVKHLVQNHREQMIPLSYMDTFRELVLRFDQTQAGTMDYYLDKEDVDYWDNLDEDDGPESKALDKPTTNGDGATPQSKPLVDYPSDDEPDENQDNAIVTPPAESKETKSTDATPPSTPPAVAPPERLSEKRRREEDEEDELGKLMQNKRRNSSSAGSNASVASSTSMAKRKKDFPNRSSPSSAPRKISINISPSVKTGGNSRSDDES
ncbi:hypothetical protein HYQ44_002309 [Verticillium longisporum]|nr:hypothetical protein HYQ44_002309 [Verticillium longisporum]